MPDKKKETKPGFIKLLACKCPRCRRGDMFTYKNPWLIRKTMKMNKTCPACNQVFEIEVGFFYGTGYVSYGLSLAVSVFTFFAWWVLIGYSLNDNRIFYWLIFNSVFLIVLQPYIMRLSRTLWLAIFIKYDVDWKVNAPYQPERTNKEQQNNW